MIGCKTAKFGMKWRKKCFAKYEFHHIRKMLGYIEGKQIILPIDQFIWNKFWSYYEYNGKTQTWRLTGFFGTGISWDIYFGNNLGKFEKMKIQTWRLTASFGTLLHSASWSSVCSKLGLCPAAKLCTLSLDVNFYFKISCILHFFCNFELVFWKLEEITYGLMTSTGHCSAKLQTLWTKCT